MSVFGLCNNVLFLEIWAGRRLFLTLCGNHLWAMHQYITLDHTVVDNKQLRRNKNKIFRETWDCPRYLEVMASRPQTSPWWTHFQKVDGKNLWFEYFPGNEQFLGDFRLVRCLHCNKLVRRGKAGCSTREASNSGMASHMRSKHSGEAVQVVISTLFFSKCWLLPWIHLSPSARTGITGNSLPRYQ